MTSSELLPHQLMQIAADFFEANSVNYRVVGSMASMAYGEPRFTNDVDMVAELPLDKVALMCDYFSAPDYYLSEQAAIDAIRRSSQFNVIHLASGLKVDVIIPNDSAFARSEASRIRRVSSEGLYSAWFGSPEDILLYKLLYYRMSGGMSEKHLRDIFGMLKMRFASIDFEYVQHWASLLEVEEQLKILLELMRENQTN